jgi:hypothetical protein
MYKYSLELRADELGISPLTKSSSIYMVLYLFCRKSYQRKLTEDPRKLTEATKVCLLMKCGKTQFASVLRWSRVAYSYFSIDQISPPYGVKQLKVR